MREQIGLVIWGCKGGYRAFCSNNVVNTGEQVIAQTIKDIRSFIRIHRTGHDFYAIEFTQKYKVFTNYRSSNDSGTGAFIAFTVYVPHNLKLINMRAMFKEMMDGYFRDYMNPLSNTPLAGKYDDINKFSPILERYEVRLDKPYYRLSSKQDDKPNLVVYDDLSVVDKYFDSPYRSEFYNCQEVMFLSKEIYDNPTNYEVEFVMKPTIIEQISEPEAESTLTNNLAGLKLSSLVINGEDMIHTNGNCPLSESDTISFSITKNKYYEDFKTKSFSPDMPLTVHEAVKQGWLKLVNKKDYTFAPSYPMTPKIYHVRISNIGVEMDKLKNLLFLFDNHAQVPLKEHAGQFYFEFSGEQVCNVYTLSLSPFETSSKEKQTIVLQQTVVPEEILTTGISTDIMKKTFHKSTTFPKEFISEVKLDSFSLKLRCSGNSISFYLPSSRLPQTQFTFVADDYDASQEGDKITFTPTFVSIPINANILPNEDYRQLKFVLEAGDEAYNSTYDVASKKSNFKLPYKVWLGLKSGQVAGSFYCNAEKLDFALNKNGEELLFYATIIKSMCSETVDVIIRKGERTDIMPIGRDGLMVLPKGTKASVDGLKAKLMEKDSSDRISLSIIEPVIATSIQVDDDPEKDININTEIDINLPKQRYVVLSGCTKFFIKSGGKHTPVTEEHQKMPFKDNVRLYNKDGVVVCHAKYGEKGNLSSDRDAKYFTVIWNGDNCEIEYKKDSVLDKILQFKKWIGGLGVLIVLIGLIWGLTPLVKKIFTSDYKYTIGIKAEADGVIDNIECQYDFVTCKKIGNGQWDVEISLDKNEEVKQQLLHNPQLTLLSESDGDTTITIRNALGENKYRDILKFFDSESDEREMNTEVTIILPSQVLYKTLVDDRANVDIEDCAKAAKKHPGKSKEFSELAYEITNNSNSIDIMQRYLDLSDSIQGFKVINNYNLIAGKLDTQKKQNEANEKQRELEGQKKRERAQLKENLNRLNISKDDVVKIKKRAEELGDNVLVRRCEDYLKFFNAKSIDDLSSLNKNNFTKDQWNVIWYYTRSSQAFRKVRDDFGMNFKKTKDYFDKHPIK